MPALPIPRACALVANTGILLAVALCACVSCDGWPVKPSSAGGNGGGGASGGAKGGGPGGHAGAGGAAAHPTGGVFGSGGGPGSGGGSGSGGAPGSGGAAATFMWSANGQSFSTAGYYEVEAGRSDGGPRKILITSDYSQMQIPCWLFGQFATVPPPPGTYSIVDRSGTQGEGNFVGGCTTVAREARGYADDSVSGMVTVEQSAAGLIRGSFTMRTRPNRSLQVGTGGTNGSTTDFQGSFTAGCAPFVGADSSCVVESVAP